LPRALWHACGGAGKRNVGNSCFLNGAMNVLAATRVVPLLAAGLPELAEMPGDKREGLVEKFAQAMSDTVHSTGAVLDTADLYDAFFGVHHHKVSFPRGRQQCVVEAMIKTLAVLPAEFSRMFEWDQTMTHVCSKNPSVPVTVVETQNPCVHIVPLPRAVPREGAVDLERALPESYIQLADVDDDGAACPCGDPECKLRTRTITSAKSQKCLGMQFERNIRGGVVNRVPIVIPESLNVNSEVYVRAAAACQDGFDGAGHVRALRFLSDGRVAEMQRPWG
jgi:hypothetical protein